MFEYLQQFYLFETDFNKDKFNYLMNEIFSINSNSPNFDHATLPGSLMSNLDNMARILREKLIFSKGDRALTQHSSGTSFQTIIETTRYEDDLPNNHVLLQLKKEIEESELNKVMSEISVSRFGIKANPGTHKSDIDIGSLWLRFSNGTNFVIFATNDSSKQMYNIFIRQLIEPLVDAEKFKIPDIEIYDYYNDFDNIVKSFCRENNNFEYIKTQAIFTLWKNDEDKDTSVIQWSEPEKIPKLKEYILSLKNNNDLNSSISSSTIGFLLKHSVDEKSKTSIIHILGQNEYEGLRVFFDYPDIKLSVNFIYFILNILSKEQTENAS